MTVLLLKQKHIAKKMAASALAAKADEAEQTIYSLMWKLDPVQTHEYISSLGGALKAEPVVAIASVLAYMETQDYRRAAEVVNAIHLDKLCGEDGWILQEDIASLALLSAVIESYRTLQFNKLLAVLREVEDVYINSSPSHVSNGSNSAKEDSSENHAVGDEVSVNPKFSVDNFLSQSEAAEVRMDQVIISDARV